MDIGLYEYVYTDDLRGKVNNLGVILPVIVRKAGHVFNEIQLLDSKNGTAL
jgi:hypothetical protein